MIAAGLLENLLDKARKGGASEAEAIVMEQDSFATTVRLGSVEQLSRAQEKRLGLRLFIGKSSATTSTSDLSEKSLTSLIADTLDLARATAADPHAGLPLTGCSDWKEKQLKLCDLAGHDIAAEEKIAIASRAEAAALDFDPRIKNSEGAEFDTCYTKVLYGSMNGFSGEYETTAFRLSVAAIAMDNGSMQRDSWFSENRSLPLLEPPEEIGRKAAERAVRRLGARKIKTQEAPVIFDRGTASSLLRHLSSACSGHSIFLGASFLVDRLGTRIAPENFTLLDDASLPGALGSRPFDAEGVCTRRTPVVEKGTLSNYLLDTYSARRLGLQTTGNAFRSPGDLPVAAPSNFFLLPGPWDPEEIISTVKSGFFVTELMGFGVNLVTADYSRGASGLWIENGELSFPVEEVTIAGNLKEMLLNVEMIGNDLKLRSRISSPTLKISGMMIAGE